TVKDAVKKKMPDGLPLPAGLKSSAAAPVEAPVVAPAEGAEE
ncbi:MAG: large subunit ribosomal protein L3, partial [Dinoroseobacter sp.]